MKIWLINNYNMLPEHGPLNRNYFLAKYLQRLGHEPVVFAGSHPHNTHLQLIEGKERYLVYREKPFPWVLVKTRNYAESKKSRVISMFEFYRNVKIAAKHFEKPDVIVGSSAHPLAALAAIRLGKKYGCRQIVEVRDLWPESIFVYSKRLSKKSLLAKLLYRGERWIYKKADAVIFTMPGGADYIKEQGWDREHGGPIDLKKVYHVNNGVDLEAFDKNAENYRYEDSELDDEGIFKIVYAGAISRVNKVGTLLDTAKLMNPKTVRFLIFGDGSELADLKDRAVKEGITNVRFKGLIEKRFIPSIVKRADLNVVHWESSPLIRYGDSSNKSFEYFAAGKPVLFTTRPNYSVVERFRCGLTTEDQKPETIAAAIDSIMHLTPEERETMCKNARKAAEAYDFKELSKKLAEIAEKLIGE